MGSMTEGLGGQVVLIAGASSGMGRATAIAVARAGAHVILAARNRAALAEVQQAIHADGGDASMVPTDFTDRDAVSSLVTHVAHLDAVIVTVGTNIKQRKLSELTAESWADMIAINLTASFNITQAIVPLFRTQRDGLIVYISSSAAKKPDSSGIAYQAAKAGLVGLANGTMDEERANGIRTTVVFPGLTDTPMVLQRPAPTPPEVLQRALQPEDIAAACLFVLMLPARAHVPELVLYPSQG